IVDGVDLMPLLSGKGDLKRDSLYWHYPHYSNQGGFPSGAIRSGPWKLIERYEDGTVHLYNLDNDIGEASDVAERYPQRVTSMRHDLHEWYRIVDAKFLEPLGDNTSPWRP
ncbi:MAG TPA: sulfatase, partial [Planctomycetaceae bacterium]|nr:sulfatase [Planctomycetaceae bacterium]